MTLDRRFKSGYNVINLSTAFCATDLMFSANVNFESSVNPKYLTFFNHSILWLFITTLSSRSGHLLVKIIASVLPSFNFIFHLW